MPAAGSTSSLNEAQARYVLIDPALDKAGWKLHDRTQVGLEVPVDGYDAEPWIGVTDYCLYAATGEVIAVIEAKRTGGISSGTWLPTASGCRAPRMFACLIGKRSERSIISSI